MFTIDQAGFSRQARQLMQITGKSGGELIRQQAKLFVKDVLHLTPPRGKTQPISESYAAQKRVGDNAVRRDIRKVFVSFEHLGMVKNPTNKKLGARLRQLSRAGNVAGIQAILRNMGIADPKVLAAAQPSVHKAARNARGRVGKGHGQFVLSESSIKSYIKQTQTHVGKWKSGWMSCAMHLGIKVPDWISRHSIPGIFIDHTNNRTFPSITLGNTAAKHQSSADLQIIETALGIRTRNMRALAERIISSGWKKGKFLR